MSKDRYRCTKMRVYGEDRRGRNGERGKEDDGAGGTRDRPTGEKGGALSDRVEERREKTLSETEDERQRRKDRAATGRREREREGGQQEFPGDGIVGENRSRA